MSRSCGECSVCCYIGQVGFREEIKPPHKKCLHVISNPKQGCAGSCKIFDREDRPKECRTFKCSWLREYGREEDRPDRSGVMVSVNEMNGGRWIFVIETQPKALSTTGKEIVLDVVKNVDLPAIVVSHGKKPPHDIGDCVVIKSSLLARCQQMIGEKKFDLADDVEVYTLKVET